MDAFIRAVKMIGYVVLWLAAGGVLGVLLVECGSNTFEAVRSEVRHCVGVEGN